MTARLCLTLALCLSLLGGILPARANAPGTVVFAPTASTEFIAYARTIRLQHSGADNGVLLLTFEHWRSERQPTAFLIERSTDGGRAWHLLASVRDGETGPGHPWPTMWQPSLFELPRALGRYPAGTLLLAGNVCPPGIPVTHFQLWRSADHGAHWAYVSTFQTGGSGRPGRGIWEPFLALDGHGALVCYFSDERQYATHSQFLGHIVSRDGGDTWGAETKDVAGGLPSDRPGMATVARLPGGRFLMSYEVCGPHGCEVRLKTSPDGDSWGDPADLGVRPETTDGRFLAGSPYLVWSPAGGAGGELLLAAHDERTVAGNAPAPESGQVIFLNTHGGQGLWSWMPAPFQPTTATRGNTNPNYSPCLLVSPDGATVRLTTASGGGALGQERTESASGGALPYADSFGQGTDAGWADYGGDWSVGGGTYRDTGRGDGDKAIAGSTGWSDYILTADVKLTSAGQAGLLARVTGPAVGADALHGYSIGLSVDSGALFVGRADGGWTPLASTPLPGGIDTGRWYHITVQAIGSSLTVTGRRADGRGTPARLHVTDTHFPSGAIGLLARNATAAWRAVRVTAFP